MLFAGVSDDESDRSPSSTHDREDRKHHSLHRSGGHTIVREYCPEMGILLLGASTDTPIL